VGFDQQESGRRIGEAQQKHLFALALNLVTDKTTGDENQTQRA
jgi:hypothetical protein